MSETTSSYSYAGERVRAISTAQLLGQGREVETTGATTDHRDPHAASALAG